MKKLLVLALGFLSQSAFSESDLNTRFKNKETIIVATDGAYPPFNYHDENGKLTGYDVEVTRAIFEHLNVPIEFKETQWDSMLSGLKAKRFDFVANQVTLQSEERKAIFDGALPYSYSGMVIVTHKDNNEIKDLADIKGKKSAQTPNANHAIFAEDNGAEIVAVTSMAESFELLSQKRADLTVNDSLAILDYQQKNPNSVLKIVWTSPNNELIPSGLITYKGNEEALEQINGAIKVLQENGKIAEIGKRFFGQDISVKSE